MLIPYFIWLLIIQCFQLSILVIFLGQIATRLREIRDKLSDRKSEHIEP